MVKKTPNFEGESENNWKLFKYKLNVVCGCLFVCLLFTFRCVTYLQKDF